MRAFFQSRYWVLAASIAAFLAMILLTSEMRVLEFKQGQRVGSEESAIVKSGVEKVLNRAAEVPLWQQVLVIVISGLILLLVSMILSPEMRKRVLRAVLQGILFAIGFILLTRLNPGLLDMIFSGGNQVREAVTPNGVDQAPVPIFEAPQIPPYLSYLFTVLFIIAVAAGFWFFNRWWKRMQALLEPDGALKDLAMAARNSLHGLSSGADYDDVIMQCYHEMSQAVVSKRGLHRESGMTAAEFALRLERSGLPKDAVRRLTRLFESVRYGKHKAGDKEISEARNCLTEILAYCGEKA